MSYGFVVAASQQRRALWERLLGDERLPVVDVRPRWVEFRDGPAWGFDLAVGRLHDGQVNRLAAYLARLNRMSYEEARSVLLCQGLTVRAADVVVVNTAGVGMGAGRLRSWVVCHAYPCRPSV